MSDTAENELEPKKKELKAKTVSLWSKIIAIIIVIAGHTLKWLGILPNASSGEICACAFTVMGVCGTVDINILVDKFTKG